MTKRALWNRGLALPVLIALATVVYGIVGPSGCGSNTAKKSGGPGYTLGRGSELRLDLAQAVPESLLPNSVGMFFCLDTSGSMDGTVSGKRKIDVSKEAMRRVFAQIADYKERHRSKPVLVGLCSFDNKPHLLRGMEPFDREALERAITPLEARGGTAIGDAMALAVKALVKSGVETRAIIVMTDGENKQGAAPDRVVRAIKNNLNGQNMTTADTEVFLVAFDVNAQVFEEVKQAGAGVKESRNQASLESILNTLVEEVLLEKPR
jgi:Mg-chelatase subunit ChlD